MRGSDPTDRPAFAMDPIMIGLRDRPSQANPDGPANPRSLASLPLRRFRGGSPRM
jgi:hypothetical protein